MNFNLEKYGFTEILEIHMDDKFNILEMNFIEFI